MSGETALATRDDVNALLQSTPSKYVTETALSVVTKVGNFLPYITLMSSNSAEVKRGKFPMGHFALHTSKTQLLDLGSEVIMFLVAWRPKAMQYLPSVLSYFDAESEEFKAIVRVADMQNSNKGFGPEFLVWLPEQERFATYFLGNKTCRNEAPNLISLIDTGKRVCLQVANLIENRKHSWHGPVTKSYDLEIKMPPVDTLKEELEKFQNPPSATEAPAEEAEAENTRR